MYESADISVRSLERAAQAWCAPTTETRIMDEALAVEFARILDAGTEALRKALAAATEHMIWMTGGWNNPNPIDNETIALMRVGIDKAMAALEA